MSPADILCQRMGAEAFSAGLSACLSVGYVRSEPGFFLMGRAVPVALDSPAWLNFSLSWPAEQRDAWFVVGMAGDLRAALACVPYPLPWMVFQRDMGKFKIYATESLTRRLTRMASKPKGPSAQQQRNEALQEQLLRKNLVESEKPMELPNMTPPAPAPPPPPPPSGSSADVLEAANELRRKAGQRVNSARGTLFAGETGGYQKTGGNTTLLG